MFNLTYDKQEVAIIQDYRIFVNTTNEVEVMNSNTLDYSNHPRVSFEEKTLKIFQQVNMFIS